jgi:hypothetical protein
MAWLIIKFKLTVQRELGNPYTSWLMLWLQEYQVISAPGDHRPVVHFGICGQLAALTRSLRGTTLPVVLAVPYAKRNSKS